ncbi:MAG: CPBP family intramembrane metalloprotease [Bacteroidetes bacterium]|jgi:hypothetical protein|nr:CPBP family intramembrane metalloprotease [Bacteroidota bacterium]
MGDADQYVVGQQNMIARFITNVFGQFFGYIKRYVKEEFDWKYLAFLIVFLAGYIYWAYPDGTYGAYRTFRNEQIGKVGLFWYHFCLYGLPFSVAYGGYIVSKRRYDLLKNPGFIILSLFAVGVFSLRQYIVWKVHLEGFDVGRFPHFSNRIIGDLLKMAAAMLPITVYWLWDRKQIESPYGFTIKNFNLKPYFLILLIMLPFVVGFGLTDHFGGYYPRGLKNLTYYFGYGVDPPSAYLLFYELIYGLDFVSIEYFFRGFLVLAFLKYVGPGSILPMAAFYVSIHFGKPMVETISSFFGGSLLGILAFYSRSIWGGIVVHMGIAWLMELGAFLGKSNA